MLIGALGSQLHTLEVSVTGGSADYELEVIENPGAEDEFVDAIDDTFFYRDLGIDYSWGNHQVLLKFGGLDEQGVQSTFVILALRQLLWKLVMPRGTNGHCFILTEHPGASR